MLHFANFNDIYASLVQSYSLIVTSKKGYALLAFNDSLSYRLLKVLMCFLMCLDLSHWPWLPSYLRNTTTTTTTSSCHPIISYSLVQWNVKATVITMTWFPSFVYPIFICSRCHPKYSSYRMQGFINLAEVVRSIRVVPDSHIWRFYENHNFPAGLFTWL